MKTLAILLIAILLFGTLASGSLIPTGLPDTVVALGAMSPAFLPGGACVMQWSTEGTGFLYGHLTKDDPDKTKRQYDVYLITPRHVILEHAAALATLKANQSQLPQSGPCAATAQSEDSISVRMNPTNPRLPGREFDLAIKDWFFHPNRSIDIAAYHLNGPYFREQGVLDHFIRNVNDAADKEKLKSIGVSAGDGVFVLGFPMNLGGVQRNYVIVRQGCIARISDMLDGASPSYLVDAFVFPGNSGSPVVLKPDIVSITGTPAQTTSFLIGMITSYQPYTDVAVSFQTKRPRVTFEENSGLAEVLPIDDIDEMIAAESAQRAQSHQ
ncbi:MAG: hypothetical protein WB949_02065 [Candidatus Acidiferrales bacterium]